MLFAEYNKLLQAGINYFSNAKYDIYESNNKRILEATDFIEGCISGYIPNNAKTYMIENWYEKFVCKKYTNFENEEIHNFINENYYLLEFLTNAYFALSNIFGTELLLELNLIKNPENSSYKQLFVNIISNKDNSIELLEQFDKAWFIPNIHLTYGKLNFDLSYL